ncbi:MAG: hypothetical protein KQH63_02820 [Desulfobulbaceae bacterium]|nr:hypothetical protein [Desulfobulbaceae bacterium]
MKRTSRNTSQTNESEKNTHDLKISRRNFLNTAGAVTLGGVAITAGGALLAEKEAKAAVQEAPPLPWKYTKLDPLEAGKRGYKNYLAKGG